MSEYIRPPIPDLAEEFCPKCQEFYTEMFGCLCFQYKKPKYWLDEAIKDIDFTKPPIPTKPKY